MDKQAVVIIHGIGEQKPMQTLRGFVQAVWTQDKNVHHPHGSSGVWSKPDDISGSFELRRLTTGKNKNDVRTDFIEFYWAHLMHGTTFTHILGWARYLLLRNPAKVPSALRGLYGFLLIILFASGLFAVNSALSEGHRFVEIPAWISLAFSFLIIPSAGQVIKSVVGDAARYLYPSPPNIQRRHEIRHAGIILLRELHKRGYKRIVVVGHSLGTVIGYDILKYYWAEVHKNLDQSKQLSYAALRKLEGIATQGDSKLDEIREAQAEYFTELVKNGHPWRVTDFVTLGSPLAHADILLAKDTADRIEQQNARELPTCLPTLETKKNGVKSFSFTTTAAHTSNGKADKKRITVPHHAATFGPTRWTNLYFPPGGIFKGDVISGPLAPVFGSGIRDIPLHTAQRGGYLSHTLYWSVRSWSDKTEPHITELWKAIALA